MKRLLRRQVLGYALGLLTATAGFAVGAAWAGQKADSTVKACASKIGQIVYLEPTNGCLKGDRAIQWNVQGPQGAPGQQGPAGANGANGAPGAQGPQGPAGSLSKTVSPNGAFSITIGNQGITLKGPAGKVIVDFQGARMLTAGG